MSPITSGTTNLNLFTVSFNLSFTVFLNFKFFFVGLMKHIWTGTRCENSIPAKEDVWVCDFCVS